jgi:hypothetical protein
VKPQQQPLMVAAAIAEFFVGDNGLGCNATTRCVQDKRLPKAQCLCVRRQSPTRKVVDRRRIWLKTCGGPRQEQASEEKSARAVVH